MQCYSAYGFVFKSEIELPLRPVDDQEADFQIIEKSLTPHDPAWVEAGWGIRATPDEIWIYNELFGCFHIADDIVSADPTDASREYRLGYYLSGDIAAFLMLQHNVLMLHSAAVYKNKHAIAFIGESGQGKSTTITLLQEREDCLFLTDDLARIEFIDDEPFIHPAPQRVKLLPESIEILQLDKEFL